MFGIRLKQLRENKGLFQDELGKILNVSQQTIGFYELDKRFPGQKRLLQLANYFNVSIDYLLGRIDDRKNYNPCISIEAPEKILSQEAQNLAIRIEDLSEKDRKILATILGHMEYKNGNGDEEAAAGE